MKIAVLLRDAIVNAKPFWGGEVHNKVSFARLAFLGIAPRGLSCMFSCIVVSSGPR